MNPKTRNLIQFSIFAIILLVICNFVYCSVATKNTDNILASVSLLVALISLFISTLTFNQYLDSKLPQIVVDTDTKSRYGLILLLIKNYGDKTAYNIDINWDKPIKNYKGKNILSTDEDCSAMKIPVLQKGQELKIVIDEPGSFYKKYKDEEMKYTGQIEYSLTNKRRTGKIKSSFHLDLSIFRKTVYDESESLRASFEIQKIPKELTEIKKLLKEINTKA
jgi:hypothetical protein